MTCVCVCFCMCVGLVCNQKFGCFSYFPIVQTPIPKELGHCVKGDYHQDSDLQTNPKSFEYHTKLR